jgi:transposase IS66 family protein
MIRKQIEAARSNALPAGAFAKACSYTLTLWEKLTRFLEYAELELSNNLAEKSMRTVGSWSKELDPHRKRAGRTEDRGDSFGGWRDALG